MTARSGNNWRRPGTGYHHLHQPTINTRSHQRKCECKICCSCLVLNVLVKLQPYYTCCVHPQVVVTEEVSGEVADLQQKLAILQSKRQEDKARLKELEKYRIQVQQVYMHGPLLVPYVCTVCMREY